MLGDRIIPREEVERKLRTVSLREPLTEGQGNSVLEFALDIRDRQWVLCSSEAVNRDSLSYILGEAVGWSTKTFPKVEPRAKASHILREAAELYSDPTNPEEMADILILIAHLAAGLGIDLTKAVDDKLRKNMSRTWGKADSEGVIEHKERSD